MAVEEEVADEDSGNNEGSCKQRQWQKKLWTKVAMAKEASDVGLYFKDKLWVGGWVLC